MLEVYGNIHLPVPLLTLDVNTSKFCWFNILYLALQFSALVFPPDHLSFLSHNSAEIHNSLETPWGKLHQISHRANPQPSCPFFEPVAWLLLLLCTVLSRLFYMISQNMCLGTLWCFPLSPSFPKLLSLRSSFFSLLKADPSKALLPFPLALELLLYFSNISHQ